MIRRSGCQKIIKIGLSLLILSVLTVSVYSQGTTIGGVINEYRHVVAMTGIDNVTLNNSDIFARNDTVLLIQMKGATLNVPESSSYGGIKDTVGSPGSYEFLIVASVNTSTRNVVFTSNIINSYNVAGNVQLIKVPYYFSATVKTDLTCQPWDSTAKTGGVVALIVGGNLTLEANINASGQGFSGGVSFIGQGICINNNTSLYDRYSYPDSYLNAGQKGEGLSIRAWIADGNEPSVFPGYSKGKGANFTSGGGGNGRFSGGGGGGSYGAGGKGGREGGLCAPNQSDGGAGGKQIKFTDLDGRILFGSGGGSSTYEAGGISSSGARGGGIIIVVCDTLKISGNKTIKAEGAAPVTTANGNAGAGGGGGGGSIALYQQVFSVLPASSVLTISANGGKGGDANGNPTTDYFGEGGGGGGGLLLTNNIDFTGVLPTYAGGARGNRPGGSQLAAAGSTGGIVKTFTPLLNGFLFNSIRSLNSDNQIDSVCSNMVPPKIIGTKPVGGTEPYTFVWQKSYESTFASPVTLSNDTDPVNYTPKLTDAYTPTDTVWFRRIVMDAGPPVITDISKAVKIIVHPSIQNNKIGNPDTLCINGNPPLIQQLMPDIIVPTTKYLSYSWQDSTTAATWGPYISNSKNYDPAGGLTVSTWYRRTVRSGSCIDYSAKVKMTVLPSITNNAVLSVPQDICFGMAFDNLTASTPATTPSLGGGDNSYRFKWISNLNGSGWGNASGAINLSGYIPVELPQKIPSNEYYFRRIVYSGTHDVCFDTSNIVHLRDFPAIANNIVSTVSANQPICSGSVPVRLTGPQPVNGNGVFTYTWQDSTNSGTLWKDITGAINITTTDYQPPVLTLTTSYRRIANSSACSDISNSIRIVVHPAILNNNISLVAGGETDTTICHGQTPHRFTGTVVTGGTGIYNYQWLDSTAITSLTPIPGATQVSYPNPSSLNETTYFIRRVTSGACSVKTNATVKVNVLQLITNNTISISQSAVCRNSVPNPVSGPAPSGGSGSYTYFWEQSTNGGSSWVPATGANTLAVYQPPVLINPIKYRRKVFSGLSDCCSNTSSDLDITINPLPVSPLNAGNDAAVYSIDKTCNLDAVAPVVTGETGNWTILDPLSALIDNLSGNKAEVRNLSPGKNYFLWTISNGLCNLSDSVYIELLGDLIPQGFSPNGDAWNNKFVIEGLNLSDQQMAEMTIINGAGTVVYTTSNRGGQTWNDWEGKNSKGQELPEGTYYYLLKLITRDNAVIKKSGFIVLKRF